MSAAERRKGRSGEQELVRLLREHLGHEIMRNLAQSRDGGCDLIGCGPFAIEVKREERLSLAAWWHQACDQAERAADARLPPFSAAVVRGGCRWALLPDEAIAWQALPTVSVDGFAAVRGALI